MRGHLIRIDSLHRTGTSLPLWLASADVPELCHIDGHQWEPNIARLPVLRYDFFGGDFRGQITAPQMQFSVSIDGIEDFTARVFADAPVQFWVGDIGDPYTNFTRRFAGVISGEAEISSGLATFTARVDDAWLDRPLLNTYAGTGDAEGTADMTGAVKPLSLGTLRFADAVLIDPIDLVYQVSDGPIQAVTAAYDRVAALGASTGDYASYAALVAASIPNGGWGTCLALGLVRLASPPDGRIAFDVEGDNGATWVSLPGAIIGRIAEIMGGTVDAANLSALDAACPYALAVQITAQTTARTVIQSIADSVGAVAGVTWDGTLFVQPLAIEAEPQETLAADGTSDIAVGEVSQLAIAAPYWRLATESERSFVVYAASEVASGYNFRGVYEAAREYRLDDVAYASTGQAYAYTSGTPGAGHALPVLPATSTAYWALFNPSTVGAPTGTTVGGRDADLIAGAVNASGEIVDAAIVTVGGLAAGAVAGAINADSTIATGSVITDSVVDGAITTRARAFTSGTVALSSAATWYDLQSITVTVSAAGEEVDIDCDGQWVITDNCRVTERLKRGASVIFTTDDYAVNTSDNPRAGFGYTDDPGAGTYTYTYQAYCNDAANASAKYRRMRALGPIR